LTQAKKSFLIGRAVESEVFSGLHLGGALMTEQAHNVVFHVGSRIEKLFRQMEKMSKCPNKAQLLRHVIALYMTASRGLAKKEFLAVATADKKLVRFLDIHGGVAQSDSRVVL